VCILWVDNIWKCVKKWKTSWKTVMFTKICQLRSLQLVSHRWLFKCDYIEMFRYLWDLKTIFKWKLSFYLLNYNRAKPSSFCFVWVYVLFVIYSVNASIFNEKQTFSTISTQYNAANDPMNEKYLLLDIFKCILWVMHTYFLWKLMSMRQNICSKLAKITNFS
jgi:hypothetical protein